MRVAAGAVALFALFLVPAPPADAELVGEFYARLKGVKTWGAYTAVLESRVYETDGSPPPDLGRAEIRFPRGAAIRDRFLTPAFFCDAARLEATNDPAVCPQGHFGTGHMLLDGRPWIEVDVTADIELFLGAPETPGAVATALVLVRSNQRSPAYDFHVLRGTLYPDSGVYGYRLELPTNLKPRIGGTKLRLAELSLTVGGLRIVDRVRTCVSRARRGGRCLAHRTRTKKVFWTRVPRCPRPRKVAFEATYAFQGKAPINKRRKINCRRFLRRPSVRRRGRIPGAPRSSAARIAAGTAAPPGLLDEIFAPGAAIFTRR
jgi:hypothetical protein